MTNDYPHPGPLPKGEGKSRVLTKSQQTAVTFTGRNVLVSAGAGTGKTTVLVDRFLHFLVSGQALVGEILALTYTDKAANEMKSRILKKLGELGRERDRRDLESSYISTIHAFCARVLREHPFEAGVDPDFRVIESEESDFLKEQAMDEALEKRCEKGNEIFELLKVYGEKDIREGILKVLDAARHDGKTLAEFFALNPSPCPLPKGERGTTASSFSSGQEGTKIPLSKGERGTTEPSFSGGQKETKIPLSKGEKGTTASSFSGGQKGAEIPLSKGESGTTESSFSGGQKGAEIPLSKGESGTKIPLSKGESGTTEPSFSGGQKGAEIPLPKGERGTTEPSFSGGQKETKIPLPKGERGTTEPSFSSGQKGTKIPLPLKGGEDKGEGVEKSIPFLLEKLGEEELSRDFERFSNNEAWDWRTVEEYKGWQGGFSRKRGKKGDSTWTEIKALASDFLARKIEVFMKPWAERFESLALSFEEIYEFRKKEKGFLDFEDLQARTVRLFRKQDKISAKLLDRYRRKFRQVLVDEFQDTNPLQLELIELLSLGDNLFFVGDFKQSIYSFRGAEPSLFLAKEKEYGNPERGLLIQLMENFRTAAPVLDFINRLFDHLWQEDSMPFQGLVACKDGSDKEPRACRNHEVSAKAKPEGPPSVELIAVPKKDEESMDLARMREADLIAERVLELYEQGTAYGEIAVLFQVMTDIGLYEQALKKRGIPYYSVAGTGFYHQPEIRDMVSFLSFLENPLADIPLAAALRSPLFQVNDNTLFWLSRRAKGEDALKQATPLYAGVKDFEGISQIPAEEKEKLRFFLKISGEFLAVKDRLKLTELLDSILEKTSYELTVLADPQGVRRYANLKKMINLAREFERVEPLALGAFLGILRRLETHEVRESEAQVEAEESGRVVRLLSIHRSKGLEFKAVIVADLAREKRSDPTSWLKAEPGAGYSLKVRNEITGDREEPAGWLRLEERLNRKRKQEWKRQFYVAATRAKEKLILSGVHKEKKSEKETFSEMACWMDWMQAMPPELMEGVTVHSPEGPGFLARKRSLAEKKMFEEVFENLEPHPVEEILPGQKEREQAEAAGKTILSVLEKKPRTSARVIDLPVSAYAAFEKSPQKYRDIYEIGYPDEGEPERTDAPEPGDSYADFGTAVHRVLELLDFNDPAADLKKLVREACAGMTKEREEEAAGIVGRFCVSPLFDRLKHAQKVYRELPFVINQRHGRVEGVIDVLFQDAAGNWHVLDYKTAVGDAVKSKEAGYELQIGIYAFAAHKILKISPKTGIVYFLKNEFAQVLELDAAALKAAGARLAGLQDSILQLGNPAKNDMI